jgi:SAM-dependent methyltransferase
MNPSAIRIAKYLFGYLGINITVDTYRRFSQLVAARNFADSLNKSMLNISCGKTDFGDINADVIDRSVRNFLLYDPDRPLPFVDKYFGSVYSSHTLERVKDPVFFLNELERVADKVFLVLPDLWMISAFEPSNSVLALNQTGRRLVRNPLHSTKQGQPQRFSVSGDVILPLLFKLKTKSDRFFKKHQSATPPDSAITDGSLAYLPAANHGTMIEYGGAGNAYESLSDDARLQHGESLARIRKNEKIYGLDTAIQMEIEYLRSLSAT